MATELLNMPKMGESITEGTVLNWLLQEGDSFEEGDVLCEVATDKVDNEITAPAAGTLLQIMAQAKEIVTVGQPLAELHLTGEPTGKNQAKQTGAVAASKQEATTKRSKPAKNHKGSFIANENVFISPLVEEIAKAHHISFEELARIPATGAESRLRKSDVMQYIADGRPFKFAQPVSESGFKVPDLQFDKGTGKVVPMDRMRQMIADHMVYSKHTSPHVTAYVEADLTDLAAWRTANKEAFLKEHGQKLTYTPLFVRAVAKAIEDFPTINSSLDGTDVIVKEHINIGMATALPSGNLIVPVVKDANNMSLPQLAAETNRLAIAAREGSLNPDDTKGGTFTISNVGTFGSLMGTPIINQPEAAILATGIIKKRAEVMERPEGDSIEIRQMMYLSLSFDHRIVDGFLAGSFLRRIADNLEQNY
ncbi:MAG: dihydrolipoamide acetyltransferase family protein [Gilvibacter sp.]